MFVLDTVSMAWFELTESISGTPPPIRRGMGMAPLDGRLYFFGGGEFPNWRDRSVECESVCLAFGGSMQNVVGG